MRGFRGKLIAELQLFPKFLKSLTFKHPSNPKAITCREQQFSFDATPIMNFKRISPSSIGFKIPCIGRARVGFEFDYVDGIDNNDFDEARKSFVKLYYDGEDGDEDESQHDVYGYSDGNYYDVFEETVKSGDDDHVEGEEGIDIKAEYFIAQFYEEMKLQRQLSFVRRSKMLRKKSTS